MDVSNAIACAALKEGMSDLYQKIDKYLYEMRMIELYGYLYGMNRQKIDEEKAYGLIIDAHDFEWNPVTNVWKARLADPEFPFFKSSRVEKNESIANAFYRRAVDLNIEGMAEAGDQYACVCLGYMYDLNIDRMAEDGYGYVCAYRGEMYEYGRGVRRNDSTAVKWYRKAAEQGHADAQYSLGHMYEFGRGVDKNKSTAVEWYRKAAEQGYADVQYHLGVLYCGGHGVHKSISTGSEWYRKAAEQGFAEAQFHIGYMYHHGIRVDKNYSTASDWYHKAMEQGHADAQLYLVELTKKRKRTERF